MTKQQRNEKFATDFSLWLRNRTRDGLAMFRNPDPIDSRLGFITTDIDYYWSNYKTGKFMFIEEKAYMEEPDWSQHKSFQKI